MKLLNSDANFNSNSFQHVTDDSKIVETTKQHVDRLVNVSNIMRGNGKSFSELSDLTEATHLEKKNSLILVKIKEEEKRAGFVMVSSITCIGTMLLAGIIFMAIKYIVLK